jgi:hypothetical protein
MEKSQAAGQEWGEGCRNDDEIHARIKIEWKKLIKFFFILLVQTSFSQTLLQKTITYTTALELK